MRYRGLTTLNAGAAVTRNVGLRSSRFTNVLRVAALLGALVIEPISASAQAPAQDLGKVARIGVLCGGRCVGPAYDAFREGLRSTGWIEGQNLVIESRGAEGRFDMLPALAADLVNWSPDVIVAVAPQPNRAAKDATASIPIVMVAVADPVLIGLVPSLARPGGNITGITTTVPGGFIAKQMELLKEMVPHATRIAALMNPDNEIHRRGFPDEVPPAAARLGFQLQVLPVRRADELRPAIESARLNQADALLVVGDPLFHSPPQRLPELVASARIPAIYLTPDVVRAGGLMSYGPDFLEIFRRGAAFVDRILRGSKPADLPMEQPTRFELVINVRTARALGITVPDPLLLRADEVIE